MEGAQPGTILLGKYRVESVLGRGGMGVVLRVTHLQLGEQLALKVLLPEAAANPDVNARFLREAQAAARLRGEHVTRVTDVGLLPNGAPYIAMEYLRGQDLAAEIGRRIMLPPGEAVDYMLQACEALAEAHAHGIVHRDIKAANLFLTTRPDGTPMVKVLDFGISKAPIASAAPVTSTDIVMGTPGYMSPEQLRAARDVDGRTDIWALGIVLYECLNGRRPFDAESFSAAVLRAGTEAPPAMNPHVPRPLQSVVLRCLEKDRAARFASIAALATALAPFARDRRAASTIVDRANLMLRRAGRDHAVTEQPSQPSPATTLSGSAGESGAMPRSRRKIVGGAIIGVGLVGLVSVVSWAVSDHAPATSGFDKPVSGDAVPGSGAGGAIGDAGAAQPGDGGTGVVRAGVADTPTAQPPADAGDRVADAVVAQDGACARLQAAQDWQGLRDCAAKLDGLGGKDKARDYAAMAVREQRNELTATVVAQDLRERNLKEAQAALATIASDSVYYATEHDAFAKAEAAAIDAAVRKAQGFVAAHDCASFRTLYKQLSAGSTSRVAASIASIKCVAGAGSASASSGGSLPDSPSKGCDEVSCVLSAYKGACCAKFNPDAPPGCATTDVDDLMTQAQDQYRNGFAASALSLMTKALACRQTTTMVRLAGMYACGAHDLEAARRYLAKLPVAMQAPIVQKCQLEGLDARPDTSAAKKN